MIEANTLLIVGAGASVPYGYPTGYALRSELCDPHKLSNLHKVHPTGIELFCRHFEDSQLYSIDAFFAKRGVDQIGKPPGEQVGACSSFGTYGECGKLAIAYRLIDRENLENLIKPKEDHWLQYLWNIMGLCSKGRVLK